MDMLLDADQYHLMFVLKEQIMFVVYFSLIRNISEFDILLTVYHYVSQRRNQLNTLSRSQTFYCVLISTCSGRQASIFRRHYTCSFWCELRAIVAVVWLQVVSQLVYWA
jgi:hypothetical protein